MSWYFLSGAFTFCLLLRSPDEPQWWRNGCRRLQPRSVLGPIGFVLMPYKVHLRVVRSALQNLMSTRCQFCLSGLDLLDFIDPTFCGIFFCGPLQFKCRVKASGADYFLSLLSWRNIPTEGLSTSPTQFSSAQLRACLYSNPVALS